MPALTIQCPSCGLHLRHGQKLLSRVRGRRGATRCPRCRDRVHLDATGPSLQISFPDLYADLAKEPSTQIWAETAAPPMMTEDRPSQVVTRPPPAAPTADIPREYLSSAPLPSDLFGDPDQDEEPVFPLVHLKRQA